MRASGSRRRRIMIFGSFQPRGVPCGMSVAVGNLLQSPLVNDYDLKVISNFRTDRDRGLATRFGYGVYLGVSSALREILQHIDLVDVHAVSDRDFLKQSAVLVASKLAGRPTLIRIHGGDFDRVFEHSSPLIQKITRSVLRLADRVVVLSGKWRQIISAIEPRARTAQIPNSVDCAYYSRLASRRSSRSSTVLMLANLCERKGHFDALEAASIVLRSHPGAEFLFAGAERDPGARNQLEERAHELGIRDRARFLGPVNGTAKEDLFSRASILILPSHQENAPLSVIEGMAAGLPVVATNVGAIPEFIEHDVTGLLIEPRAPEGLAAAVKLLLDDPERRRVLGSAANDTARQRWDLPVVADLTARLYAEAGVP